MEPVVRNAAEPLWTAEEVADYLRVSVETVKKWVKLDQIPHGKAGSLARFRKSDIDAWLASNASAA